MLASQACKRKKQAAMHQHVKHRACSSSACAEEAQRARCDLDDLALSFSALGIQTVPRAELARQSYARVTGQRQSHKTTPESRQSHATTPESRQSHATTPESRDNARVTGQRQSHARVTRQRQSHATTPESRDNARVTLKQCRTAMSRAMLASRGASKAGTLSRAELSQATSCLRG